MGLGGKGAACFSRGLDPFAVGAIIDLGNCLDLTESLSLQLVKTAYEKLVMAFELAGVELPQNRAAYSSDEDLTQRYLDCAVFNHLHDLREEQHLEPFTTVRGPFTEGDELYPVNRLLKYCAKTLDTFRIRPIGKACS